MFDSEFSDQAGGSKPKQWTRLDTLTVLTMAALSIPGVGLALAIGWVAYEAFLALRRVAAALRQEVRDFVRSVGQARRQFFESLRTSRPPAPPEPPPPPTPEELAAEAKGQYEQRLRLLAAAGMDDIEVMAAREHAKQQYLRDIDEAMK